MDRIFFEELELPQPEYNLDVGSGLHGEQTGKILEGVEKILLQEKPDVVLVQGDTNTVSAGALAAAKLHIPVAHVEAGLRSFDRRMPGEINRVVADHLSDFLFAPTETARRYLEGEGIPGKKIHVTGNTVVDAVFQNLEIAKKRHRTSPGLEDMEIAKKNQRISSGPEELERGEKQRISSGPEKLERGEKKECVSLGLEDLERSEKQRISSGPEELERGEKKQRVPSRLEELERGEKKECVSLGLEELEREVRNSVSPQGRKNWREEKRKSVAPSVGKTWRKDNTSSSPPTGPRTSTRRTSWQASLLASKACTGRPAFR